MKPGHHWPSLGAALSPGAQTPLSPASRAVGLRPLTFLGDVLQQQLAQPPCVEGLRTFCSHGLQGGSQHRPRQWVLKPQGFCPIEEELPGGWGAASGGAGSWRAATLLTLWEAVLVCGPVGLRWTQGWGGQVLQDWVGLTPLMSHHRSLGGHTPCQACVHPGPEVLPSWRAGQWAAWVGLERKRGKGRGEGGRGECRRGVGVGERTGQWGGGLSKREPRHVGINSFWPVLPRGGEGL